MALPKITQDRINEDARQWANNIDRPSFQNHHRECGYIAGATAENERAQKLAEALEKIAGNGNELIPPKHEMISIARDALQQWNAGKEVEG